MRHDEFRVVCFMFAVEHAWSSEELNRMQLSTKHDP